MGKKLGTEVRMLVDQFLSNDQTNSDALAVAEFLKSSQFTDVKNFVKLPGDASTRRYYRIENEDQTTILMKMDPFPNEGVSLNFLILQKHLSSRGIAVPAVLDVDPARGFILLEDLGDTTLLGALETVSDAEHERKYYESVLSDLIDLQINATPTPNDHTMPAFQLRFDEEKLMWEVGFTIEHFYQKYLARTFKEADLKVLNESFSDICGTLAKQPTVLCHRDFHSRNIMVVPDKKTAKERFVMIDFQDARMGPAQYDLASLLKDSYYQLESDQVTRLLNYYIVRREALEGKALNHDHFIEIFDMMSLQRSFKAIGSFASFLNRRGNPGYLKYIGNTFESMRRTLLKYPKYKKLREVLFHYYYF